MRTSLEANCGCFPRFPTRDTQATVYDESCLTDDQIQDLRSQQRTFDGAVWRTAVANLSAGLVVYKIFSDDLYKIGIVLLVLSLVVIVLGTMRKAQEPVKIKQDAPFITGGNYVALMAAATLIAWITILYMILTI
ncbi:hypothetical protein H4R34_001925 [Dimargaris verticillata]|uniref:DUF202 domain-containing protein n=1 Tax=Dimargaris verticillata TaxID=2761393 RepID=A0A9W8EE14_9FUNG|nr:hypothetical protein H4R34_001925 [Dimargaris verticillata]